MVVKIGFEILSSRDYKNHCSFTVRDEIGRLLESPEGCWMGTLGSESTALWTSYHRLVSNMEMTDVLAPGWVAIPQTFGPRRGASRGRSTSGCITGRD